MTTEFYLKTRCKRLGHRRLYQHRHLHYGIAQNKRLDSMRRIATPNRPDDKNANRNETQRHTALRHSSPEETPRGEYDRMSEPQAPCRLREQERSKATELRS